jgi:hypothetical protein
MFCCCSDAPRERRKNVEEPNRQEVLVVSVAQETILQPQLQNTPNSLELNHVTLGSNNQGSQSGRNVANRDQSGQKTPLSKAKASQSDSLETNFDQFIVPSKQHVIIEKAILEDGQIKIFSPLQPIPKNTPINEKNDDFPKVFSPMCTPPFSEVEAKVAQRYLKPYRVRTPVARSLPNINTALALPNTGMPHTNGQELSLLDEDPPSR